MLFSKDPSNIYTQDGPSTIDQVAQEMSRPTSPKKRVWVNVETKALINVCIFQGSVTRPNNSGHFMQPLPQVNAINDTLGLPDLEVLLGSPESFNHVSWCIGVSDHQWWFVVVMHFNLSTTSTPKYGNNAVLRRLNVYFTPGKQNEIYRG
ncbi:hypothetical protein M0804_001570 [Polistes exclamans]|nr:hypothetical protein M0804_001570 [Polistes exclamans]